MLKEPNGAATGSNPNDENRFTLSSIILILGCLLSAVLDGYDVVIISYAVPELSKEWSEPLSSFGIVFSVGLIGLVLGALGLAPLADQHGRRRVMIGALVLGAVATIANGLAVDLAQLIACRFFVGLAMGVIVALVVTIAHEASPPRWRVLIVTTVGCGLSIGNLASGLVASFVLPRFGWQPLFIGAGVANLFIAFLFVGTMKDTREPPNVKRPAYLSRIGSLFGKDLAKLTLVLWLLHFGGVGANYLLLSWLPSLLTRAGYAIADAALATSLISFGGLAGGLVSGFALARLGWRWLLLIYISAVILIASLPFFLGSALLYAVNFLIGVCIVGGYISNNVVTSHLYPESVRAGGLGWAQGVGRTGSVVTPLIVALALQWNASLTHIVLLAAVFPLMSALATIILAKVSRGSRNTAGGIV